MSTTKPELTPGFKWGIEDYESRLPWLRQISLSHGHDTPLKAWKNCLRHQQRLQAGLMRQLKHLSEGMEIAEGEIRKLQRK